ncbi:integrator complex subunit 3 isoform X1 [Lates japonicus]|uniref:Integrator complex subunit 3 isoform X1 n=1 Tax=Lates japonicus TaxID=270547 RepID=A0AAD3NHP2_LATJO|nr:integrator complex subunit 3 isoform X1 [Lates japonicus]
MEEAVSMDMDNHVLDKEEGCYDNTEAAFSDDEEEVNNKGKKREFRFHPIKEAVMEEPADITPWLDQLDDTMKEKVLQLQKTSDTETQCEVMQEIVDLILEEDFDTEQMSGLASCLAELFKDHFRGDVLPEEITEESLEESVCKPVCLIFRNLVTMQEDNIVFSVLLDMLAEPYQKQPKIGYHLLYYLKASKAANGKMMLYESFAQATALSDLHTCLMMDMKSCQEDDVRLLCYLTPSIYSEDETLEKRELLMIVSSHRLHTVTGADVSCDDGQPGDVQEKDSVLNILIQSLDWETFEQYSTWQLFLAHSILRPSSPSRSTLKHKGSVTLFWLRSTRTSVQPPKSRQEVARLRASRKGAARPPTTRGERPAPHASRPCRGQSPSGNLIRSDGFSCFRRRRTQAQSSKEEEARRPSARAATDGPLTTARQPPQTARQSAASDY